MPDTVAFDPTPSLNALFLALRRPIGYILIDQVRLVAGSLLQGEPSSSESSF